MSTHVEQSPPRAACGPSMHDLVAADLLLMAAGAPAAAALTQRKEIGLERYGRPLQAFNGRDAARDAREEALDLLVYLRQAIEEGTTHLGEEYRVALWLACQLVWAEPQEIDKQGS